MVSGAYTNPLSIKQGQPAGRLYKCEDIAGGHDLPSKRNLAQAGALAQQHLYFNLFT